MNIFNKVTLQSLKKNRTRTIVTIIGIMLSTALICAVTTSFASVRQYAIGYYEYENGKCHGIQLNTDRETYEMIKNSDKVKDCGVLNYIGYADIKSTNDYKPYLYISGFREDEKGIIPLHLTSGRFPQNSSELLIPDHLRNNGGVTYKEGDKITLEVGERKIDLDKVNDVSEEDVQMFLSDDMLSELENIEETITQQTPMIAYDDENLNYVSCEKLDVRYTQEYTVVGTYERPSFETYFSPGYTALTVFDEGTESPDYSVFYRMKNMKDIYSFIKDNNLDDYTNGDILRFNGISKYDSFYSTVFGLMAVVIGLIMFGSIMLIYNAFTISVSERTKQFGLLSSIGSTKKQLRKMVRFEATFLSFIGIPLGIILGNAGMWVTFLAIGKKFYSIIGGSYKEPLRIHVSFAAIIAAAVIAFITIRISSWIPSKRATRISAVEAIRQNSDIKQKKYIRTPKIISCIFGLPGVLAHKYFKRSKKKYRATIISLFMSIVMFVSAYSFTSYLVGAVNDSKDLPGADYVYEFYENNTDYNLNELLGKIKNTGKVTDAAYYQINFEKTFLEEKDIKEKTLKKGGSILNSEYESTPKDGSRLITFRYIFVDDESFRALLKQHGLSESKFMNKEKPLAIALDNIMSFNYDNGVTERTELYKNDEFEMKRLIMHEIDGYKFIYINNDQKAVYEKISRNPDDVNEEIELPLSECSHEESIYIGHVIDERPFFIDSDSETLIYPYSFMKTVLNKESEEIDMLYSIFKINTDDTKGDYNKLRILFDEEGLRTDQFFNYAEELESERNGIIIVKVFAYGFIVLISLIAAANVFNTINTNVNLRRREFAMLRSVGMTSKAMRRMLNYECIMYGTKALVYGLPVASGVTYLIYRAVNNSIETPFTLPWGAVGVAVLSVFLVVFSTMLFSMSKIKKDNTIDALKNENL